jgi:hypothetical protein
MEVLISLSLATIVISFIGHLTPSCTFSLAARSDCIVSFAIIKSDSYSLLIMFLSYSGHEKK